VRLVDTDAIREMGCDEPCNVGGSVVREAMGAIPDDVQPRVGIERLDTFARGEWIIAQHEPRSRPTSTGSGSYTRATGGRVAAATDRSAVIDLGRLGSVSESQLAEALARLDLGSFRHASPVPFGLFGQNVFVEASGGSYVLRLGAHFDWQFPTEQFFCELIHERSDVPVPSPYLWEPSPEIFGFPWGYVLMPRLPGVATADADAYRRLTSHDREGIAQAPGDTLRCLHTISAHASGAFDHNTARIGPFATPYLERAVERLHASSRALPAAERAWITEVVAGVEDRGDSFAPVLVHGTTTRTTPASSAPTEAGG
jgi:hypothetical protein